MRSIIIIGVQNIINLVTLFINYETNWKPGIAGKAKRGIK
jgi:hypothetical protein